MLADIAGMSNDNTPSEIEPRFQAVRTAAYAAIRVAMLSERSARAQRLSIRAGQPQRDPDRNALQAAAHDYRTAWRVACLAHGVQP